MWSRSIRLAILLSSVFLCTGEVLAQKSLEKLLKESKLDYTKGADGSFKVWVSYQGETSEIQLCERQIGQDDSDPKTRIAFLYSMILPPPEGRRHPPAMLKKVAELNDRITIGRIGISEENGGTYYNSSFWLSGATISILVHECAVAHFSRLEVRKILEGY